MLAILFYSTDGNQWRNSSNWVTSNDHSSWYKVGTDLSTNYALRLDLYDNELTGSIPSEIAALTSLTVFFLGVNDLNGPIPSEIAALTSLEYLFLDGNDLTGPIPPEIAALTSLFYLGLNDNALTGPIPVEVCNLQNSPSFVLQADCGICGTPTIIGCCDYCFN